MRRRLIISALITALLMLALLGFALRLPSTLRTVVQTVLASGSKPHGADPVPSIE